ncbi:S-adenosylmethionine carrier 1 [Spatholobus suberectus]|nr:S-adenosylmethionine carrier 1 [Spatholobus suberectus]
MLFLGALAGMCVSLCLHPVDTIKTVIQSCRAEHRSIFYIGKSIVSDRGLLGLYRGIATNIACSAPISAVYTFSYESVKAALLPYLPSERIKQQMQVGSHYRNCCISVQGCIGWNYQKWWFFSLYAGWRAVLCRNVHIQLSRSFYTYESLKQVMPSLPSSIQPNTFQTIPGSANQYDSVLHALYKISKSEGLKGLYRGLTPRLIMYMSQGSLFFASYEFFKRAFSL